MGSLPNSFLPVKGRALPRFGRAHYQGLAAVHWSMSVRHRSTGWLTEWLHARVREIIVHTAFRYRIVCAAYCLMPDHMHMLWIGCSPDSDQIKAHRFFVTWVNEALGKEKLQKQSYDHVLIQSEREHDALCSIVHYIIENPVRAGLLGEAVEYLFSGGIVPGYPNLDIHDGSYFDRFWKATNQWMVALEG